MASDSCHCGGMEQFPTDAKRALRLRMRLLRAALADRSGRSASIWVNVIDVCAAAASRRSPEAGARLTVLAFNGVGSEPDTTGLIALLRSGGHTVLLPRVQGEVIIAVPHHAGEPLHTGAYGIPEPYGPAADPASIDVVVVPGLAFTTDGRRLGQGGGYYDRFLALVRPDCVTCGVAFSEQIVADLPSEPHDRILSTVVTDVVAAHAPSAAGWKS